MQSQPHTSSVRCPDFTCRFVCYKRTATHFGTLRTSRVWGSGQAEWPDKQTAIMKGFSFSVSVVIISMTRLVKVIVDAEMFFFDKCEPSKALETNKKKRKANEIGNWKLKIHSFLALSRI
jgi:hypothetical protein